MKSTIITLVIGSALVLATASLRAEGTNSTPPPSQLQPSTSAHAFHLIPPMMVEKLKLTDDQKEKLKSIEESFAKTYQEYKTTHKDEIEAAQKSIDKAMAELQEQRKGMEKAMAGLQEQRKAAQEQFRSLLTDEQMKYLPSPKGNNPPPPPQSQGTQSNKSSN